MSDLLPTGTVTVLFAGLDEPSEVVAAVLAGCSCVPFPGGGVFDSASDAVAAAVALRTASSLLRIALHTGEARVQEDGRHTGPALRGCERLREIANAGQTLVSASTASELPADAGLRDRGLHRLQDLTSAARVFELGGGVPGGLPLRSLDVVPNNLPVQLTSFVGRRTEADAVHRLLAAGRLVTLSGAGGCGKTRLAAQVAADQAARWPGGVWWVELGAVTEAGHVADAVAATAGVLVEPAVGAVRSLAAQLREGRVLICLDNCEHVLDGAAEVADALLRSCPEAAVLTTSREPLGVPGEVVWRVPELAGDEALALFVERAGAVRPWFTLDASSEAAVRKMCARLDGIPLALELAAAWLRTLTPQQIEAGLDDRFALLVRGPRGAVPRQQTLAASMAWSHDLLDEPEQVVFRRLAVFAGAFTLDAARAVGCVGVLESLGRLVDKSLVVVEEHAGEARFRLLETIRQYAAERLREAGEADAVHGRHLAHYLALAESAEPVLDRDKDAWRALVEPEQDNLRAALDWGLSAEDPEPGRRLAASLAWLWNLRARGHEGLAILRRALVRAPQDRSLLQVRILIGLGQVADTTAPFDIDSARLGVEIATEHGDDRLRARCLVLTALDRFYTDFDAAWDLCLDAEKATDDEYVRDSASAMRGMILHLRDQHGEAESLLRSAGGGLIRRGERGIAAAVLGFRSSSALSTGELGQARELAEQAVAVAEPLGDYHRVGSARSQLALVHCFTGDVDGGLRIMEPFLRLVDGADNPVFVPGMARAMGSLHYWRGDIDTALAWFERDAPAAGPASEVYLTAQALPPLGAVLRVAGRPDEAAEVLERAVRNARRGRSPRILADALEQQGHLTDSAELHHEALSIRCEHGLRTFYADSLDALAAGTDKPADAVRVLAASDHARAELTYPRRPFDQAVVDNVLNGHRETLGEKRFAELWAEGTSMPLDDAVAFVRRARGARGRPSSGWESLTPTERDVVRLAAEGLNNPEIGARLFMSRGTVKTHLSHVYAKLGIANRTELATQAAARLP
jgi:predicted ATPase/DNA-binding CsgD family transcriptional regulator